MGAVQLLISGDSDQWEGAVQLLVGDVISGRELYSYWLVT